MKKLQRYIGLILVVSLALTTHAQQLISSDYYSGIKKMDAGRLWRPSNDKVDSANEEVTVPEPLGFIGDQYQRFYIHYLSVIKNKSNPYEYIVHGKTKVKENICSFHGTITIVKAALYKKQFDYRYKQGFVECLVDIKEDSAQKSSGFFKGRLTSKFYLDEKNELQYDDLLFGGDGYFNNQCEATWTDYHTKKSKRTNWGDYRIPASKELDMGDGEFAINKKYQSNGWQNYVTAWTGDPEKDATQKAQEAESDNWWK